MKSLTKHLPFNIPARMDFLNITPQVEELVHESGVHVVHSGIISGLQGYKWNLQSHDRPLSDDEKANLPSGLSQLSSSFDLSQ